MNLEKRLKVLLLRPDTQKRYRIVQLILLVIIVVLEFIQINKYHSFSDKAEKLNLQAPGYFDSNTYEIFGIKSYYTFVTAFTLLFTSIYVGLFDKIWRKNNLKRFLFGMDVFLVLLWFTVSLTNTIPARCDFVFEHSDEVKSMCRSYHLSMFIGWVVFVTYIVAALFSWKIYENRNELSEKTNLHS